ncbi:hypothetical protein KW800_00355 [Candidatus Parcubacteria bacterium]|nr:hypothetical protein [Candidatus Parcubacteria bacterium]
MSRPAILFLAFLFGIVIADCGVSKMPPQEATSSAEVQSECLTHFINFATGTLSEADSILSPRCDATAETRPNAQRLRSQARSYLKNGKMPKDP